MICKVLLLILLPVVWIGLVSAQFRPEGGRPQRPARPQGPPVRPSQSRRFVCLLFICLHLIEKILYMYLYFCRYSGNTSVPIVLSTRFFRNKRFMLDKMTYLVKCFQIRHIYGIQKPKKFFSFCATLIFPLMNALVYGLC